MQRPDPDKQKQILAAAGELFASKPFHEVRLDEVAAAAGVGKGTLYLYTKSKEELYLHVVRAGFAAVGERLRADVAGAAGDTWGEIEAVVRALTDFAFTFPGLYQIMRSGTVASADPELLRTRGELTEVIERVLRDGVMRGELGDARPELTAQYLLSFVRGALLYPPEGLTREVLREHMLGLLRRGIAGRAA